MLDNKKKTEMKKLVLLITCMLFSYFSYSQIGFERDTTYDEGPTSVSQTMELNVYGTNTSGVRKRFVWTVLNIFTPRAWSNALCTFPGSCFNIIPGFKDSFEIDADSQVLMRVDFSTNNVCGEGLIKVQVAPADDLANTKFLYFAGKSYCTGIVDPTESDRMIQIYPNPSCEKIYFNSAVKNATVTLYNTSGEKIDELNIDELQGFSYDVSKLTNGIYYVFVNDQSNDKMYVKEFSKN